MAANIEDLFQALSLETTTDVLSTLIELRTALASVSSEKLSRFLSVPSVCSLFVLLNSEESEVLEECCAVLKIALTAWSPAAGLHNFRSELETGLQHPAPSVQSLCLRQLELVGEDDQMMVNWEELGEIIQTVIKLLASPSLQSAKQAQIVILNICHCNDGIDMLYSPVMLSCLEEVLQEDDTVKFRVYELLVRICKISEAALQKTHQCGLLQKLLNEVYKDDILTQLNCLELLSDLGMIEHGLIFLDSVGIVKQLETLMSTCETDPMTALLIPGLIKFFGGVAHFYPKEICSQNRTFVNLILTNLSSTDNTLCSISIQTIGIIGKTTEGKLALDKLGNMFIDGLQKIGKMIRNSATDLREKALQTAADLIYVPVSEQTTEICQLTEMWFNHLDSQLLQIIMSIAKQPFPELKFNSHRVLSALAVLPWGQKKLCEFPGFSEYLLDRSTEKTKEEKESKFEIVKILAESPTVMNIFDQPYYVQLKAFFLQGPYYIQAQSQVAFEGD